jgi:hypothetical protein
MGGPGARGGERADGTAPTARCLRLCGGVDRAKAARSTPTPGPSDRVNNGGLAGHDPGERFRSRPTAAPFNLENECDYKFLRSKSYFQVELLDNSEIFITYRYFGLKVTDLYVSRQLVRLKLGGK